jgi:hypothetical protein
MLIDGAIIEDLEKADLRLMERRLVNFEASDVTTAEIALGTQTKRIQQKKPDPAGEASSQWSDVGDEAAPNQSYTTWMERIDRLRLMGYATDADLEKLKGVEPFMKVTFFKGDAPLDELTFKRVADPTGKQIYWAESRFLQTAAQITESRMTNLEKDADAILKGTAPVSEEAQPANPHGIAPANPHSAPPTDAAPPVSEGAPKE